MKALLWTMTTACVLAVGGVAQAEHNKECKNIHGKLTVVTDDSVTVNDKLYNVGDTTRITKDGEKVKVSKLKVGDVVCLDARGKDEIDTQKQIAAITVLTVEDGATVVREKESTTEKTREKVREKRD